LKYFLSNKYIIHLQTKTTIMPIRTIYSSENFERTGVFSVKPIFSDEDTVNFVVPLSWSVYQFQNFVLSNVSTDWRQVGYVWAYTVELLLAAQTPSPYEVRFGTPDPRWTGYPEPRWTAELMTEYAPSIGYTPSGIMGEVYGDCATFYMRRSTMAIENIGDPMYSPSHTPVTAWSSPVDVLYDDFVEDWATLPPAAMPTATLPPAAIPTVSHTVTADDADEHNAETFGNADVETDFISAYVANWASIYPAVAALTLDDLIL
jgi:hypothetical protein